MQAGANCTVAWHRRLCARSVPDHRRSRWRTHQSYLSQGRTFRPSGDASRSARGIHRGLHRSDDGLQNEAPTMNWLSAESRSELSFEAYFQRLGLATVFEIWWMVGPWRLERQTSTVSR